MFKIFFFKDVIVNVLLCDVLFDGVLVPLVFIVCSLEIYMGCGNKVITPKLSEGQELDGSLILKVFKLKALYVKPSRPLLLVRLVIFYDFFFLSHMGFLIGFWFILGHIQLRS